MPNGGEGIMTSALREVPMPDPSRPGRENYRTKARRFLIEGRVLLNEVTRAGKVDAVVRGESGLYQVTCTEQGYWSCPCYAKGRCSHVEAVSLVVTR